MTVDPGATARRTVTVGLSVDGLELGGAELSLVNLVEASWAIDPSIGFSLVGTDCPALAGLAARLPQLTVIEVDVKPSRIRQAGAFTAALRSADLDLLQVTLCNPTAGIPAQLGGILAGVPTIAVEQLVRPVRRKAAPIKAVVSRLLIDHVAVGTKSARQTERYAHLPTGSVRVIHNGVPEPENDEPIRRIAPAGLDSIGTIGRLVDQKGVDRLIKAVGSIPKCHLTIVGDGIDRHKLEDLVSDNGLADRVTFVGWRDRPGELLRAFDVFVLASRNEAFPLTISEAFLRGTPVVATDVGSVSDAITNGHTGILVRYTDDESLASPIRALLTDRDLAGRLAQQGRNKAHSRFTSHAMAMSYIDMWRQPRGRVKL